MIGGMDMSLFKPLKGDSSRISMDVTPFHDGYVYLTTDDGGFYVDVTDDSAGNRRIRINPDEDASRAVNTTLLASAWSDGKQTLTVEGLGKDQNGIIGLAQNISTTALQAAEEGKLYACGQRDGELDIGANGEVPVCDIPVTLILFD
jgi:hypothetical protein